MKKPTGAVRFTQRFGSRLDLSVHHHCVLPDGVFTVGEDGVGSLVKLPTPREEELEQLLARIVRKTRVLAGEPEGEEPLDAHAQAQAEAVHLCRYGLCRPLAKDRLSIADDGRVVIELKRPMYDGTREVAYELVAFLRRLAAVVPPPRFHTTKYFGVFAPASKVTLEVSAGTGAEPACEPEPRGEEVEKAEATAGGATANEERPRRLVLRRAQEGGTAGAGVRGGRAPV